MVTHTISLFTYGFVRPVGYPTIHDRPEMKSRVFLSGTTKSRVERPGGLFSTQIRLMNHLSDPQIRVANNSAEEDAPAVSAELHEMNRIA